MADGSELRVHPTGKAILRVSCMSQGQGHETTYAQIVAEELGIPPADIQVLNGDTENTPFGLGTYGSRSTPVSGAAAALVARKVRDKAQIIASGMLEVSVADLEWTKGAFAVKGDPTKSVTIQDIAMRAHGAGDLPEGIEGGLEAQICYNPSNLTYPFGAYICVVDVDPGTGHVKVRSFVAVDDCGTRINPMIIEGQIHGGLTDGVGMALMEIIAFDEDGNCLSGSLMDYLIPTVARVPRLADRPHRHAVAAPPDRGQGRGGVGDGRVAAGDRQRGGRRAEAVRGAPRRHAPHALPGVGGDAGPGDAARSDMRPDARSLGSMVTSPSGAGRVAARMAELIAARVPFVHATVVRAQCPTSAHPGDAALVLERRDLRGLRRRPVRGGLGAHRVASTCSPAARRCCCASCPRARRPSPTRPAPARW